MTAHTSKHGKTTFMGTMTLALSLTASLAPAALTTGPQVLINDPFADGSLNKTGAQDAQWYFVNTSTAGTSWNTVTDNTAPLSGTTMQNPAGGANNTIAVAQWNQVTLGGIGNFIQVSFDLRNNSTPTVGAVQFSLCDSQGTSLSANSFGNTATLDNDNGYGFYKNNAAGTGFAYTEILNGLPTHFSQTDTINWANTNVHHVILRLTLTATGVQQDAEIDGIALASRTDTTPLTYSFDTLVLSDNASSQVRVDNFLVSVPEPSVGLLLGCGALAVWGRKRRRQHP